ncbi:MAG: RNA polymerase sigma factor [bacterium]|nr:RNA polymerase sigma factor [bacterium]
MGNKRKEFSKIYDQCINKIYRFIFLKVNSEEIAQDLCSETFLRGWASFNSEEKIENCQAFLYTIARNLTTDYYREKGRTQFVSTDNLSIIDPELGIEERLALKSDLEQVKLVLANLNEDYQNVIIWHYLDDLPIPEVAKMMDKSESTTRVTLHRALQALKNEISRSQTS